MNNLSYWLDIPYTPRPALAGNAETDVVVIGGGITGVSAAYHCAKQGLKTILIEKNEIASGSAGKNGGMLVAALNIDFVEALEQLGEGDAVTLWRNTENARAHVISLIQEHSIDCDFSQPGSLYVAKTDEDSEWLARECVARQQHGFECRITQKGEQFTESSFGDALYVPKDGLLHPAKFVRGLAAAAEGLGATLYEHTPAITYDAHSVTTSDGTITAQHVIVAIESGIPTLTPAEGKLKREIALVTEPLEEATLAALDWKTGGMFWGTETNYIDVRKIGNRLFLNGDSEFDPSPTDYEHSKQNVLDLFHSYFPSFDMSALRFSHEWTGLLLYTVHNHPFIIKENGYHKVYGQGATGLTNGVMTGKMISELLSGKDIPEIYRKI
jgi:gamma-glutamylputrescine oxidase